MIKYVSPSLVGPYGLNVLRVSISLCLFWLIWTIGKTEAGIKKEHLGRFVWCGFTGVAANQMLFIKGLTMTSTIHASLLMLCTPLLITLFAFWILKEKGSVLKFTGLVLGIGGALLLILSKEKEGNAASSLAGDLLIILNAIAYTIYFILVKPLMQVYPPLHVVRWAFTFGFILILPFGWMQFSTIQWQQFEWSHLASLSFIVMGGTFLAYFFNAYGIRHLGAGITGSYIYTQPVFTAVIATLFLQERFTFQKILAGVLIFSGVFLVSRKTPPVVEE
jgi:drug/metabolite transporter (DMT)-like permease